MTKSAQQWFDEYGESHQNPTNKVVHWICVPLIVVSLIGLLWSIPVPISWARISPYFNWAVLILVVALAYYYLISVRLALGMTLVVIGVALIVNWMDRFETPLWKISTLTFIVAWIGQFIGHMIEGTKPSFFQDLQFLLISPLWLLGFIYRCLRLPY